MYIGLQIPSFKYPGGTAAIRPKLKEIQLQKKPVTAPIIGATKITHLEDAVGALTVKLTQEDVAHLEEPYVPHRIVGDQ